MYLEEKYLQYQFPNENRKPSNTVQISVSTRYKQLGLYLALNMTTQELVSTSLTSLCPTR